MTGFSERGKPRRSLALLACYSETGLALNLKQSWQA
jgi:hypothetical protein